jgi:DNA-binding NarL/FixJ family response regulator
MLNGWRAWACHPFLFGTSRNRPRRWLHTKAILSRESSSPVHALNSAMATTPLAPQRPKMAVSSATAAVAVVATDAFALRRITAALEDAGLEATHVTGTVQELLDSATEQMPEAIVLACDPFGAQVIADLRRLTAGPNCSHVVVISQTGDRARVRQVLGAGADGVVLEAQLESTLAAAIQAVLVGHLSLPRAFDHCILKPAFSHREKQALAMVVRGYGNRQIADRLYLAESTVKTHLSSAFQKLGVRSRKEAALLLMDPDEGLGVAVLEVDIDPPRLARSGAPRS